MPREYASGVVELARQVQDLDPATGLTHPLMLARFMTFLKNVSAAADMLRATAAWREEVGLAGIMREWGEADSKDGLPWRSHPRSERAQLSNRHFCLGRAAGLTRSGQPLVVAHIGSFDFAGVDREGLSDLVVNQFVFVLEDVLQAGHTLSLERRELVWGAVVADIEGLSFSVLRHIGVLRELARIANQYYPDLVDAIVIVNAPAVFTHIWSVVSALMEPSTRRKVQILGRGFSQELEARGLLDAASLPALLGGKGGGRGLPQCRPVPEGAGRGLDLSFGGRKEARAAPRRLPRIFP